MYRLFDRPVYAASPVIRFSMSERLSLRSSLTPTVGVSGSVDGSEDGSALGDGFGAVDGDALGTVEGSVASVGSRSAAIRQSTAATSERLIYESGSNLPLESTPLSIPAR